MLQRIFFAVFAVTATALVISTEASSTTRFGAKLDNKTQPSNAGSGIFCSVNNARPDCTWVLMQAYQCEFGTCINGHLAPKDGIIAKISLIACAPGSFALQIARANSNTKMARVIRTGPQINYVGDPKHCNGLTYKIESFPVNIRVRKNDYLAAVTQKLGFVRCSGGGDNTLLFHLPLADGGVFRPANKGEGCFMLLEAFYND